LGAWTHADGAWSQHLGRASYDVPISADLMIRIASDGDALNRIVLPLLDESASALSSRSPRWILPPVRSGLRAGFVALSSFDDSARTPKVLLRSEPVPEAVPTRVALDLDLTDTGSLTHVVARWDVGVQLPMPGLAARAVQPLLGAAVERLVRRLVHGLATAADDYLDEEIQRLVRVPATRPGAQVSGAAVVASLVPPFLPILEQDAELEALLDEVIDAT
jgi:hypothetical protein